MHKYGVTGIKWVNENLALSHSVQDGKIALWDVKRARFVRNYE